MEEPSVSIGVDIGGTFTDMICRRSGEPDRIVKIPSTPADPSVAVMRAVRHMADAWGVAPQAVARFVHGTTVATNAVIERKGARIGLLCTAGFRDVLEIGRQMRQQLYSVILEPETPAFLAPGAFRKEVTERIGPQGEVVTPLDEGSVVRAVDALVAEGAEALAVCYLFSFANPAHERRTRELVAARHPALPVSLSCEVDPAFREYERTVVTAFDAYIKPIVERYLANLERGLGQAGVPAPLQIMQSRGGIAAAAVVRERPVRLFLSGPAGGVIGGQMAGAQAGFEDLITVDIGGTSCDIALIAKAKPLIRQEGRIAGYPVRVPMVDVNAIGAGGGSIAWIDPAGGLRVGPHSTGADPGPACYGQGGGEATVTDASVVLGYLNPDYFAGGRLKLDAERARAVIAERIAAPLGLPVEDAALGIHRVVNAQMAEGIRLVSIRQGIDPRGFALLMLGGAGPVHGTALAGELGIGTVVVPRHPGILSAAGLLAAKVEHEVSAAWPMPIVEADLAGIRAALGGLDARAGQLMAFEQVERGATAVHYFADVCYIGQAYTLEIRLHLDAPDPLARLTADFLAAHDRIYGYAPEAPARIVNLRTVHHAVAAAGIPEAAAAAAAGRPAGRRRVRFAGGDAEAAVHARDALADSAVVDGPAIVEQEDTTTVIEPGWRATARRGVLVLERSP